MLNLRDCDAIVVIRDGERKGKVIACKGSDLILTDIEVIYLFEQANK
jgi:hypothetical protein